jgi:hypothetical protein
MTNYNTRSWLYTIDYKKKGEKYTIVPAARRMQKTIENGECTWNVPRFNTEMPAASTRPSDIPTPTPSSFEFSGDYNAIINIFCILFM